MKHKTGILICLLSGSFILSAQEKRTLTLKEAVDLTLQNSKQLTINAAKVLEAAANVKEAEDRKLPDASVSTSYLYLPVKPSISMKTNNSGNGGSGPKVSQAVYGTLNVSLPVYTGGRIKYGIESAKFLQKAVELDAETDKAAVVMNAINACINLFKANEAITLMKENLLQAQQRVKDLSSLEKNGLLARNDLLKAELQASNTELALLDAESNYTIACVNLSLMTGLPEHTVLVPDKSGLSLPDSIKTLDEYEQSALQNRNDFAAVAMRNKIVDNNIKSIRGDYYPNIALTGGYIAADIPGFLTVYNAINIGVGIKYNISSLWKTKTKLKAANAKLQEVQASRDLMSNTIRMQVNQAFEQYLVSRKKIEVMGKSVLQATENYRITKNKFDNSLSTTTELLDADVALLQAKLSVTNAKADSFLAYQRLLYAAGQLKY